MAPEMQIALGSSLQKLIERMRSSVEQATTQAELLRQVSAHVEEALLDPDLVPADRWSYRDPDDLFMIHAGPVEQGSSTGPHDHGHHWVIYGVRSGALETLRYQRLDDGSDGDHAELRETSHFVLQAGEVDVIEPWGIHDQHNSSGEVVLNLVVRGTPGTRYLRNRFELETNRVIHVTGRGGD